MRSRSWAPGHWAQGPGLWVLGRGPGPLLMTGGRLCPDLVPNSSFAGHGCLPQGGNGQGGIFVWLNADVLPGPNTRSYAVAIPPEQFVPLCRRLCPHATLSLGWRTAAIGPEEAYTQRDADAMAKLCADHALPGSAVVFAAAAVAVLREALSVLVRLLAPFAPHLAEEFWQKLGGSESVHQQSWPELDQTYNLKLKVRT